jgi:predicted dienelactone hydrolase
VNKNQYLHTPFTFSNQWSSYNAHLSYKEGTKHAPLVIFLHGFAAKKEYYKWIGDLLVQKGYVFAAFNAPVNFFKIISGTNTPPYKISMAGFSSCIDYLTKMKELKEIFNFENIGAMGHSLGGLTALLAAEEDARIKAVVALSPPVNTHISLPTPKKLKVPVQLQIGTYEGQLYINTRKYYQQLKAPEKELIIIEGGNHILYMDPIGEELPLAGKIIWSLINTVGKNIKLPYIGSFRSDISLNQQHHISSQAFIKLFKQHLTS